MDKVEIVKKHILSFKEIKSKKQPRTKDTKKIARWENEEKSKEKLRQLVITKDGDLIGGSQHRVIKITNIPNDSDEDIYILKSDQDFPPYQRLFDTLSINEYEVKLPVKEVKKTLETIEKVVNEIVVTVTENKITFTPIFTDPIFVKAEVEIKTNEQFEFKVNPTYLLSVFKLAQSFKLKYLDMLVINSIRPVLFKSSEDVSFNYLVSPIRTR